MHEYFSNFKKFIILKKIMWKKNFIWWKTSSFLGKIFNGKILRFFRQKWPLFWSKFLYFGYPENISGFRVLNVGFRVGFGYRPLGFGSGSGGLKCRVYPSGFRVFGSPDTSLPSLSWQNSMPGIYLRLFGCIFNNGLCSSTPDLNNY